MSSDVEQDRNQRKALWDAVTATVGLQTYRKLARRTGLLESYLAELHYSSGCLDPRGMLRIRVNRYRVRATIKAEIFDAWQDAPSEVKRRFLTPSEWQRIIEWVEASGFWQLPNSHTPSSSGFGGHWWTIEGFRDDRFHSVRRTSWTVLDGVGSEVFRLGRCMVQFAGLNLSEDTEN